MAASLSRFPMVQCFYEQLEAIMEMRELSRAEQSSPSDDRPLSLGPLVLSSFFLLPPFSFLPLCPLSSCCLDFLLSFSHTHTHNPPLTLCL